MADAGLNIESSVAGRWSNFKWIMRRHVFYGLRSFGYSSGTSARTMVLAVLCNGPMLELFKNWSIGRFSTAAAENGGREGAHQWK